MSSVLPSSLPYDGKESEKVLMCPYNDAHFPILSARMATHLVKCRKNYPNAKVVVCMYNSTHVVPEPELQYHLENCRHRIALDKYMVEEKDINRDKYPITPYDVCETETWDNVEVPTYDPQKYMEDKALLITPRVEAPSVKKNFRMENRQKFQILQSENKNNFENNELSAAESLRRPLGTSAAKTENTKTVNEDNPTTVENLLKKVAIGAKSGPQLPGSSKNAKSNFTTERVKAFEGQNGNRSNDAGSVISENSVSYPDSGHGPWTSVDVAKRINKQPVSMGRGRSIKK